LSDRKLSDWITAFMRLTENTEPAPLFRKWTAISVLACALRRKCRIDWGSLTFYPNLYVVLVGPSGCRKGTAMDPGYDIASEIPDIKLAAEATTREALIRQLEKANYTETDLSTGEMQFHSSLTIWSQELTVFLGYHNRQLMADLCDWYDCRSRWKYETKTQGINEIVGVWVHLHAATTPDLIQTSIPLDAIGGGLTSRMVMVYEPSKGKIVSYPELTSEQVALKQQLIIDLGHINNMKGAFKYTEGFMNKWVDWYSSTNGNPPFKDHRFTGYFERRPTHVMKLSMIMSASRRDCIKRNEMVVTADDLELAIATLEETEIKMPNVFSGVGRAKTADLYPQLTAEIAASGEIEVQELMARFYRDTDQRELEVMLGVLEYMGSIKMTRGTSGETRVKFIGDCKLPSNFDPGKEETNG